MSSSDTTTPLIDKYSEILEKNPKSRVFAPLAEVYRKMGLVKQALNILREGIRQNPDYVLGYVGLAHCYFDMGEDSLAYTTIKPYIDTNKENLLLQKLYGDICLKINHREEALSTFKLLLFMNPKNVYFAEKVKELEDSLYPSPGGNFDYIITEQPAEDKSNFFNVEKIDAGSDSFDEWVEVKFNPENDEVENLSETDIDSWSVEKEVELDDVVEDEPIEFATELIDQDGEEETGSVYTQTLVDLYCSQGHTDKAVSILEKIIELNPKDQSAIKRLNELEMDLLKPSKNKSKSLAEHTFEFKQEIEQATKEQEEIQSGEETAKRIEETEEAGRQNLMSILASKFKEVDEQKYHIDNVAPREVEKIESIKESKSSESDESRERLLELEGRLWRFHELIKSRAANVANPR